MTLLNHQSPAVERTVTLTAASCAIGFMTGFVLSLVLAAYSLYACIHIF